MKPIRLLSAFAIGLAASTISATANDWPHWLGPNSNNVAAPGPNFDPDLEKWKIAWEREIGLGYSAVTIDDGRGYSMGHDGNANETIICFDANTGQVIWTHKYQGDLIPKMHAGGPNASITVNGNSLYALSKDGLVKQLNAKNGQEVWATRLTEVLDMEVPRWGFASSPYEYGDWILLSAGKTTALDKKTGKAVWTTHDANKPGYATPIVFSMGAKDYVAAFDSGGFSVLQAKDGKELARLPVKAKYDLTAATPVVTDNGSSIFLSINTGSKMLSFDGKNLNSKWEARDLQNYASTNPVVNGAMFGIDGHVKTVKSKLYAVDFETGDVHWTVPEFGYASMIAVGNTLLIMTEAGELVTAKASPDKYQEISRRKLLEGINWTHPVYANDRIYIRNEDGRLLCLERS